MDRDEIIDLRKIGGAIGKRMWMIVAISLLAALATGIVSYFVLAPVYEAKTDLLINRTDGVPKGVAITQQDIMANLQLIDTYNVVIKSPRIIDLVAEKIGMTGQEEDLMKQITVEGIKNSQVISISVQDKSQKKAVLIANTIATVFQEEVVKIMQVNNVQALTIAKENGKAKPVKPNKWLNMAIAFTAGFLVSIGIALYLESKDQSFKNEEEAQAFLGLTVLGTIHQVGNQFKKLITHWNPKSPISESFRTLRINIEFMDMDEELSTIMVTSSVAEEGKSFISSNLSIVMGQDNKKTLYVDADMRRPTGQETFSVVNDKGLSNYLRGKATLEEIVQPTDFENVFVIGSGPIPPNPVELLGSKRMMRFMNEVKGDFDMVILDTPPTLLVADPVIMSKMVDGCLLVVRGEKTDRKLVLKAKQQLENVNAPLLGLVFNDKSRKTDKYNYAYK